MNAQESLREISKLRLRFQMNNRLRLESLAALSKIFREHGEDLKDDLLSSLVFALPFELPGERAGESDSEYQTGNHRTVLSPEARKGAGHPPPGRGQPPPGPGQPPRPGQPPPGPGQPPGKQRPRGEKGRTVSFGSRKSVARAQKAKAS